MAQSFEIDGEMVRQLANLLQETGLTEIEIAEGDRRIRVTRQVAQTVAAAPAAAPAPAAPAPAEAPTGAGGVPDGAVTSPMVGTAYLASDPGATPFVRPGDSVTEGQTVLIVEAMKVMNPIRAPRSGTVRQVLVKDAQPVEFGEVLLIID